MPPCLMPLLKAGFVEPDIEVGDTVAPRADTSVEIKVVRTDGHASILIDERCPPTRGSVVGVWLDDHRVRAHRFRRDEIVLIEPREPGPTLRAWIVARLLKRRGRRG